MIVAKGICRAIQDRAIQDRAIQDRAIQKASRKAILAIVLSATVSACAAPAPKVTLPRPTWKPPERVSIGRISDVPERIPRCKVTASNDCVNPAYRPVIRQPLTIAQATQALSGKTQRSYAQAHGTQVTYFAPDGRVYLWYPGNWRVLAGQWKVSVYQDFMGISPAIREQMLAYHAQSPLSAVDYLDRNFVCFRYADSFNPAMGLDGRYWECANASEYVRLGTAELAEGDLFGLASKTDVPLRLPRDGTDLDFAALRRLVAAPAAGASP